MNKQFEEFINKCINQDGTLLTIDSVFNKMNLDATIRFLNKIHKLNKEVKKDNKKNNNKEKKTIGVAEIFNGSVFEYDEIKEFVEKKSAIIQILLHCNWLMYICSEQQHEQQAAKEYYAENADDYFNTEVKWSIGATLSHIPLASMMAIVQMTVEAKNNKWNSVETILQNVSFGYKWDDASAVSSDAVKNIILFLCDDKNYLPIPAQDKKTAIVKGLASLVVADDKQVNGFREKIDKSDVNYKLFLIRKKIRDTFKDLHESLNPFWHPSIRPFWDTTNPNLNDEKISDETLLEYKKAMVLYGPPGTSKSYLARKMAENIIAKTLINDTALDMTRRIEKMAEARKTHIHKLQLHPNYTYDDFIIGKTIQNNHVIVEKGYLLKLIDSIDPSDKLPHIVILDEINRVDLSRVFGELFTAMESSYREDDEGVELSVTKKLNNGCVVKHYLKVPQNMYFIGTMNMIDFSLEQIDFALRRRFLWRLSTYEKKRLEDIIGDKMDKLKKEFSNLESIPEDYSSLCTSLNKVIKDEPDLGKDYVIGHTFFADVVDIYQRVQDWEKSKNVLWQISILPTLEAYCGTMNTKSRDEFVNKCKDIFLPQKTENAKGNNISSSQENQEALGEIDE